MCKHLFMFAALMSIGSFLMAGCGDNQDQAATPAQTPDSVAKEDHHDDHAHPTSGPHGGDLIELGDEEYHAELVHPVEHEEHADHKDGEHKHEGEEVTVYILDGAAKEQVAIEGEEITLNLRHDGKALQFKLAAQRTENDPEGKSSRFVSKDHELIEHLHEKDVDGTLVLTINGKSYRGKLAHDHGHDHDHDHKH